MEHQWNITITHDLILNGPTVIENGTIIIEKWNKSVTHETSITYNYYSRFTIAWNNNYKKNGTTVIEK